MEATLECVSCGSAFPGRGDFLHCPTCGNGLQLTLDLRAMRFESLSTAWQSRALGVWRYGELLPVPSDHAVTLGEGGTALVPVTLGGPGFLQAYVKTEGQNPTGSFKDRGMTVGVTQAVALGRRRVICASTGNTAASLAAYAARAGLECVVLIPAGSVAQGKLAQAYFEGARVVGLRGTFDDAMRIVFDAAKALDAYVLNSVNPYRIEGQKTAAFEVFEQLGGRVPDWVVCPVGNGGNLAAYGKGFQELRAIGATDHVPQLAGIQAEGAAPIADTVLQGRREIAPVERPETVASAIRIGNPANWRKTVRAIRESRGLAVKIPDAVILDVQKRLAREEGIFLEPASAAGVAGAMRLAKGGTFAPGSTVVCVGTGHGLKDPEAALRERVDLAPAEPTVASILAALGGRR